MKKSFALCCIILLSAVSAIAQVELCQGAYFTEAQGKEFLQKHEPTSLDAWKQRAEEIRQHLREGMQLTEMPPRPSSAPIINGKRVMDGYTIENVAFESLPGIYVTGNLYRPLKTQKSYAGILSPHGHWDNPTGRFQEQAQKRCGTLAGWAPWYLSGI
ncbi:MAG: hypothetical protein QM802_05870 [Agriterribacter sp.]